MKKTWLIATTSLALLVFTVSIAWAAVTLRYYNEDSTDYTWEATCSGSKTKVTFDKSKTSSVTIQGSAPCTVHTPSGDVVFKADAKIRIKNGKVKVE